MLVSLVSDGVGVCMLWWVVVCLADVAKPVRTGKKPTRRTQKKEGLGTNSGESPRESPHHTTPDRPEHGTTPTPKEKHKKQQGKPMQLIQEHQGSSDELLCKKKISAKAKAQEEGQNQPEIIKLNFT